VTRDTSTATLLGTATVSDPSLADETGIYDFVGTDGAGAFEEIEHMVGTVYDDVLSGEDGHDDLAGGSAADRLDGGVNDDFLTGGTGDDTFVMSDGGGMDTITDFDMGDADANGFTNDQLDLPVCRDQIAGAICAPSCHVRRFAPVLRWASRPPCRILLDSRAAPVQPCAHVRFAPCWICHRPARRRPWGDDVHTHVD